jgi:DNA-binding phage protein
MIFTVSMTSGVDHDRVEGRREAVQSRMSEMLLLTEQQVTALLSAALDDGHAEYQQEHVRAWINTVH